ncbi:DUF2911 domain-containing protein [Polaribacter sargassicola]|uniref:DUF2911 domain-containing protein n=1 Tax=Polaribacter sargassicola TaxID=2836891 RepID=UPI001F2BB6FD|nr:DUF2911 domain-containing protein [Polaribacter sp. DS7-9]MCG1034906.1 DUF2911 domain-containing protein [Polaribacter sp. DS7-9]
MKKSILTFAIFAITLMFSSEFSAQKFPKLDVSPMDVASYPTSYKEANKIVKVIYSRPQLKGRDLEKLAPKDKVWRTGANEATEIYFYKDVTFGGKKVKAGRYTMFSIPSDNEWTIILSTAKNVWGSYFYKEEEDVVRVNAEVSNSKDVIEAFSVVLEGESNKIEMFMGWGNTIVSLPIEF